MIGVILCGGLGTRIRSVLPDLPKAMAPVRGRPFLEYQVDLLRRSSVQRILLCVGYRWEAIAAHFGGGDRFGVTLQYSVEESPLGTAGCLKHAAALINEPALVLNGDTFLSIDPSAMHRFHQERGALATVAATAVTDAWEYGSIAMNDDGRITAFQEKHPGAGFVNAGAYLLDPATLDLLEHGRPASLEYDLLPALLQAGKPVYGYQVTGPFLDIGTPERYRQAVEGGAWDDLP